jgi:4-hydroxybenzoate polyprenyltransferase
MESPGLPRGWFHAFVVALRPHQWTKNGFVFAGLVFAAKLGDIRASIDAFTAFAAYCAASSSAYLVNDLRDAPHDRVHPTKRYRPIARGEVSTKTAITTAGGLAALSLGVAAFLGWYSLLLIATFLALQIAYSIRLKHLILIDAMAIASLFVIRAAAGAEAVSVKISPWLLLCTALLALFLAFAKRRAELVAIGAEVIPTRPVLESYSLILVDQLLSAVASSTIIAYALYTFNAHGSEAMMATIPFVVFGVFRYLVLVHKHDLGEEPERVLVSDKQILIAVGLWVITAAIILISA